MNQPKPLPPPPKKPQQPPPPSKPQAKPAPVNPVPDRAKNIELWFDTRDASYWFPLAGKYIQLGTRDLNRHFRYRGLSSQDYYDGQPEIEWPIWNAQINGQVDYAGSLGGRRIGLFTDDSRRRFLVIDEAKGVWDPLPREVKEPKFFLSFIQELLPEDQWQWICYWLSFALRSLRKQSFTLGQAMILAGPKQCGKSFLLDIVTAILGGRQSNPTRYFMGETPFNEDICQCEHWRMDDPKTTTDTRARRLFGCLLKEATANSAYSIHPKHKTAITLELFRRVCISVNDEPENLAIVPPLDDSLLDKVFLLHCSPAKEALSQFVDSYGEYDRPKAWAAVQAELPMIRAWLLKQFRRVPKDLRDNRYGIRAWQHEDLAKTLLQLNPETRLMQLIEEVILKKLDKDDSWTGDHMELERALRNSELAFEAEKVLKFQNAAGTYLGRLKRRYPNRISSSVKNGYTRWTIKQQPSEDESE